MDYLDEIVAYKRAHRPGAAGDLEQRAHAAPPPRPFLDVLGTYRTVVIAECKKASPSRGVLAESYDPVGLARTYDAGGARAISVLTDEKFFQGSLADLEAVRAAIDMPVLRKDFTLDRRDLLEARAAGADIVLLIARILDSGTLEDLVREAAALDMDAIVEVHDEADIDSALKAGSLMIGINNRDLASFSTSLEVTERLIRMIPSQIAVVSESGIFCGADVARLHEMGVRAVLVGEALIRAPSVLNLVEELVDAGCPDCWPECPASGADSARLQSAEPTATVSPR
jgi:indole-3-glycerol phosphate synthase